ncbi:Pr6Pr family membrane protein [Ferruginibacter sp. SUN002]|uniref:Pr6Pr family membrane protein n=1 Tax=Ferruginibacter sp. SUN002 TaxID=2937789 RepID=UPI003D36E2DE
MQQQTKFEKIFLLTLVVLGWFALIGQFYLHITLDIASKQELFIRFFSYFTILTNLFIAICSTVLFLNPHSSFGKFFQQQQTRTALTIYIVVVGIIYNTILRFIWDPQGMQRVVDELLHLIIPVLFLLYWLIIVKKDSLQYKNVFPWLLYPFIYAVIVFIRGAYSGFYPYPFIDADKLGWNKALQNAGLLTVFFLAVSLLFVAFGKFISKRKLSNKV